MKNSIYILTMTLFFSTASLCAKHHLPLFTYARIDISKNNSIEKIYDLGLNLEDAIIKSDSHIDIILNQYEINILKLHNIDHKILIYDMEKHISERSPKKYKKKYRILNSDNFALGSVAGFYTLNEMTDEFNKMKEKFPEYFQKEEIIGKSAEGRNIYSYSFGTDGKPEILLTGMHHAREPIGTTIIIYFLWKLMELAESGDLQAKYLLENRHIWVVPVINLDGWHYNYSRYPNGGGLWRKNRRLIVDSTYGVDLNRNYGPYDLWNAPNSGSSVNPSATTYRGDRPFSEPETQAVSEFCNEHDFLFAVNYHSYGNYIIYPFAAINKETDDSLLYRVYSKEITDRNRFSFGTSMQTVRYPGRGTSDDWMYSVSENKNKILAITPEIGTVNDSFYPNPERIVGMVNESFYLNFQTCWSAGINVRPSDLYYQYNSEDSNYFVLKLRNIGLQEGDVSINIEPLNPFFEVSSEKQIYTNENWKEMELNFDITVPDNSIGLTNGDIYKFEVEIIHNGISRLDTFDVKLMCYDEIVLFDAKKQCDPNTKWIKNDWGLEYSEEFNGFVFADSPQAYYPDSSNNYLIYRYPLPITMPTQLLFTTTWNIEPNDDFAMVQISTDDGDTWNCIKSSRMVRGSGRKQGRQDTTQFGFHGNYTGWVMQRYDMSEYLSDTIMLRFGLISDHAGGYEGWKLKNVILREFGDCPELSSIRSKISNMTNDHLLIDPDLFQIDMPDESQLYNNITIYDVYSDIIYRNSVINKQTISIPVSNWITGKYFIRILSLSGEIYRQQLMIIR